MREQLQARANLRGRSISEEVEDRLELSIGREDKTSAEAAAVGDYVAFSLHMAERCLGRPWHSDKAAASYCFDRLKNALAEAMAVNVEMPANKLQQAAEPDVTAARTLAAYDNRAEAAAASPLSDEARAPWELVPSVRPATPDEIAGMVPSRGQLPPEIVDRALFDDAVSGLPLVQAEKVAEKPIPGTAPTRRKARAKTETEA